MTSTMIDVSNAKAIAESAQLDLVATVQALYAKNWSIPHISSHLAIPQNDVRQMLGFVN